MPDPGPATRRVQGASETGGEAAAARRRRTRQWSRPLQYVFAVTVTIATLLAYLAVSRHIGNQPAPIIFLFSVALSAYAGGLGPGLVSTMLGVLTCDYFTVVPTYSFKVESSVDYVRLASLLLVGALISTLSESLRRTRRNLRSQPQAAPSFALETKVRAGFALALLALVLVGTLSYRSVAGLRADVEVGGPHPPGNLRAPPVDRHRHRGRDGRARICNYRQ